LAGYYGVGGLWTWVGQGTVGWQTACAWAAPGPTGGRGHVADSGVTGQAKARWNSATVGLKIVGLFPQVDEGRHHDGRGAKDDRCPTCDKLLGDEHADVLLESVAWMARELMEADVSAKIGAELGERSLERSTRLPAQAVGYPGWQFGAGHPCPYLWLDAKVERVREPGGVRHKALVIAYGVHESGRREVIGLDVGETGTEAFWWEFLRSLRGQGPGRRQAVHLGCLPGLEARDRAGAGLPLAALHLHFLRDMLDHVTRAQQPLVSGAIHGVAALDLGKAALEACVRVPHQTRPGRRLQEVRGYATTTRALLVLADWLHSWA
jgi:Transposase, Mutator family